MLSLSPESKAKIVEMFKGAELDVASFYRTYRYCGLGECGGACCYGGAGFYVDEEHQVIQKQVDEKRAFFEQQGAVLTDKIFDEEIDENSGELVLSTNVRDFDYSPRVVPPDFPHTSCVFRTPGGSCTLQALGISEGKPSWWYKPLACWLFPIQLEDVEGPENRRYIHVVHPETDDFVRGGEGFVQCGIECNKAEGGKPAYEILTGEIAALSELLGRDIMKEILAYKPAQTASA